MAQGMLINTLSAMGFPSGHRIWDGFPGEVDEAAGSTGGHAV